MGFFSNAVTLSEYFSSYFSITSYIWSKATLSPVDTSVLVRTDCLSLLQHTPYGHGCIYIYIYIEKLSAQPKPEMRVCGKLNTIYE